MKLFIRFFIKISKKKNIDYEIVELPKQFCKGSVDTYPKNLEAGGMRRLQLDEKMTNE